MKVVWLKSEYLFPPDTGGKTRAYHLLRHLHKQIDVDYLGFRPAAQDRQEPSWKECANRVHTIHKPEEQKSGAAFYGRVAANLVSATPYFVKRNCSPELRGVLRDLETGGVDIVVCDSLDMACNIDFATPARKILFHPSIETSLWRQRYESTTSLMRKSYFNYETKRMASFESAMCNRFDLVVVVSEDDRLTLQSEFHVKAPIEIIPVGVACDYFAPQPSRAVVPKRLMFSGSLELLSNIDQLLWFASEILPLIKRRHPDVTLDIVGKDPAVEIIALGMKDASIFVTGWVDDIRLYLAQADIYIVPLRVPGGRRVKVYEALAMRKPVVATSYGVEGLLLKHGRHLLVADTPRDFADAVCALLDDPHQKATLADNGWRLMNEQFDYSIMARLFVNLLHRVAASPARPRR
ncbi:MAG: glycosyltransferase family 4 protein [Candidatus Zixiibacteriota bacterium]